MLTKAVYGAVARSAGRAAARRQLAGGGIDDRSGDPLDAYLQDLASWVEQRGYSFILPALADNAAWFGSPRPYKVQQAAATRR